MRRLAGDEELSRRIGAGGLAAYGEHASEEVLGDRWRGLLEAELERAARPPVSLRPVVVLWAAVAAFTAGFASLSILRHLAFNTGRFDLGNMAQAVWSTAHGDVLSVTDLHGEQISRLGAHFDPILAAFAPLWWLWPDPTMLLTAQAVAIALGAWPVFLLARKHLGSDWAGLGFGLAYLLYPSTQWLALNEFHAVALATPLLLFAFWFLDEDRLVAFSIVAALACLTKEHVPLAVAALGVWYALARGRRRAGAIIAVRRRRRRRGRDRGRRPALRPGRLLALRGPLSRGRRLAARDRSRPRSPTPFGSLEQAFDGHGIPYLLELVLPLLALPLLAPLAALTALPELAANLLSSTRTQTSIHFHYTAAAIPGLMVAAVLGAARLRARGGRLRPLVTAVVVAGVVCELRARRDPGLAGVSRRRGARLARARRDSAHDASRSGRST